LWSALSRLMPNLRTFLETGEVVWIAHTLVYVGLKSSGYHEPTGLRAPTACLLIVLIASVKSASGRLETWP
jgi:hypothetical protein